jgi:hypothetical protein
MKQYSNILYYVPSIPDNNGNDIILIVSMKTLSVPSVPSRACVRTVLRTTINSPHHHHPLLLLFLLLVLLLLVLLLLHALS